MARSDQYRRIPGSAAKYRAPDGSEVSKKFVDNLRARETGYKNYSQYLKLKTDRAYDTGLKAFAKKHGISESDARKSDSEFNKLYVETFLKKGKDKGKPKSRLSHSSQGPLNRYLVETGLKQETHRDYAVGETPGVTR